MSNDLERLERCWRLLGESGRHLTCAIYRHHGGDIELRLLGESDEVVLSERVANVRRASERSEDCRLAAMAQGFTEVSDVDREIP